MSDATNHFRSDKYPWRELFGEPVIAQLAAFCDAARDIVATRARERLRQLREAHEADAATSIDDVLLLLTARLACEHRGDASILRSELGSRRPRLPCIDPKMLREPLLRFLPQRGSASASRVKR